MQCHIGEKGKPCLFVPLSLSLLLWSLLVEENSSTTGRIIKSPSIPSRLGIEKGVLVYPPQQRNNDPHSPNIQ